MAKIYLALLAFCLFPAFGWAQESVSGTITSTDEPAGLPGAAVSIEGSKRGIASSVDGTYTILLEPSDSVLLVSFVGYATQRISIAGRSKIDVVLSPEMQTTEEVVVIGYGTQRKSDITGSISSVKGDDLIKVPNNNPIQALQGKATGVQVVSNSGSPGQAPKVRIRGVGSFGADNKNGPLYVVDGVFMRDITNINSQDIVSIEVLKDASSAAIFGVEGANGVILVTTKQGKDGKTNFSVQAEYGLQNGEVVEAANFNDPMQTVIAGSKAAVDKACELLKAEGAKRALLLAVSAPFHSSLMKPAAEKLKEKLLETTFAPLQIPLINNIDVAIETDVSRIRDALYRQAFGAVRWVECMQAVKSHGISHFVECGPGKVLAGLVKRIDADLTGAPLFDPASMAQVKEILV